MKLYKCELCDKEHDGTYASGRFCSSKCSHSAGSNFDRKERNRKIGDSLRGKKRPNKRGSPTEETKKKSSVSLYLYHAKKLELVDTSKASKQTRKRLLLKEQENRCLICGDLFIWMGNPLLAMEDHVDGNRDNNKRYNLRLLCPNCHSQTPTYGVRNISDEGRRKISETAKKTSTGGKHNNTYYKTLKVSSHPLIP